MKKGKILWLMILIFKTFKRSAQPGDYFVLHARCTHPGVGIVHAFFSTGLSVSENVINVLKWIWSDKKILKFQYFNSKGQNSKKVM